METKKKEPPQQLVRFDWAIKRLLRHKADYVVAKAITEHIKEGEPSWKGGLKPKKRHA